MTQPLMVCALYSAVFTSDSNSGMPENFFKVCHTGIMEMSCWNVHRLYGSQTKPNHCQATYLFCVLLVTSTRLVQHTC